MIIEIIKEECERYEMGLQTKEETLNTIEGIIKVQKMFNNMTKEEKEKFFKEIDLE